MVWLILTDCELERRSSSLAQQHKVAHEDKIQCLPKLLLAG